MQHRQSPLLKLVETREPPERITGGEAIRSIVATMDDVIPRIMPHDPSLDHLRDLRTVLGASLLSQRQPRGVR